MNTTCLLTIACTTVLLAGCAVPGHTLIDRLDVGTPAVVSDADHLAQTYRTGQLAPLDAGAVDSLTVLRRGPSGWSRRTVTVSNSVTAAPEVVRLTPDGRHALVIERLGARSPGVLLASQLPAGERLSAVDVEQGAVVHTVRVATYPEAIATSPDGRHVAIVANTAEAAVLQIVSLTDGRFGDVQTFPLQLAQRSDTPEPRHGVTATNVAWHPSGRQLAVNLNTVDRVVFLTVNTEDPDRVTITPWGAPVPTGRDPFVGRFTPDGGFYLTANWGRNFSATSLEGRLPQVASSIGVIRLGNPATGPGATHQHMSTVETDLSSEGLAVSPDGRLVATVNMRGTAFDPLSARYDRLASVTLLRFDPVTGHLEKLGDTPLDGVLPEGGSFDLSGRHFLATVYQAHDAGGPGSGVEVFRVVAGVRPTLEPLGRMSFPPGTHGIDLSR